MSMNFPCMKLSFSIVFLVFSSCKKDDSPHLVSENILLGEEIELLQKQYAELTTEIAEMLGVDQYDVSQGKVYKIEDNWRNARKREIHKLKEDLNKVDGEINELKEKRDGLNQKQQKLRDAFDAYREKYPV